MADTIQIIQIIISTISPVVYILVTWWLTSKPQRSDVERNIKTNLMKQLTEAIDQILSMSTAEQILKMDTEIITHKIDLKVQTVLYNIYISLKLEKEDKKSLERFNDLIGIYRVSFIDYGMKILEESEEGKISDETIKEFGKTFTKSHYDILTTYPEIALIIQKSKIK